MFILFGKAFIIGFACCAILMIVLINKISQNKILNVVLLLDMLVV